MGTIQGLRKRLKVVDASNKKSKNTHKVHILELIEISKVFCRYKMAIPKMLHPVHPHPGAGLA